MVLPFRRSANDSPLSTASNTRAVLRFSSRIVNVFMPGRLCLTRPENKGRAVAMAARRQLALDGRRPASNELLQLPMIRLPRAQLGDFVNELHFARHGEVGQSFRFNGGPDFIE